MLVILDAFTVSPSEWSFPMAGTVWQNNIRNHLPAQCRSNSHPLAQSELRSAAVKTFVSHKPLGAVSLCPSGSLIEKVTRCLVLSCPSLCHHDTDTMFR